MTGRRGLRRFSVLLVTLVLSTSSGAIAQIRHDSTGQAVDDERAPGAMGLSPEEARERREEEREERMRRERARQERLRQERLRQERLRREREERERERLEQERQERIRRERVERRRREREERERLEREEEARLERERRARAERRRRQREEREAREEEERLEQEREERAERARREERERLEQERQQRAAREARLARAEQERAQRERERAVRLRQQREAEELEARQEQERQDQRRRRPRATDPQEQDDEGDEDDVDEEPADEEAEEEEAEDSPSPPPATASRDRGEDETEESDGDGWADEDAPDAEDDDDAGSDETDSDDPETADESPRARRTRRRGESARARGPGEPRPTRSRRDRGDEDRDDDDDDDDGDDDDDRDDDDDSIPITFGGSSTLIFERRANNGDDDPTDDNYYDGILRAQAALEIGRVRLSTRVDGALFLDNPEGADRRNDIRPERVLLEGDTDLGPLTLRAAAGDFYAQIGRGLILSLRRVDEIGIDTALRGGRIEVGGRDGGWNLQVMGGLANPANLDNQRLLHVEDPNDFIGGTRVEARLEGATLALHGAWARVGEAADEELGADQTWAFGGEVETTLRDVTMAVELDWQARRRSGEDERGFAIYGTASAPIGPLTLLAELKHYSEFEVMRGSIPTSGSAAFAYSAPPTAERVDQEVLDNTDVTGGRLQGDLAAGDATTLTLSGGLFYNRFYDRWFSHVFGGGDHRWTSGASLALHGGYRREWDVENGDLTRAIAHGEADATIPVTRDWSAHGTVRHESHVEVIADERLVYHRGTATLELDYRHQISFTGGFEWDTHGQSPDAPQTFGFGLVTWSPNDIVSLRLLAGTQRGGLKCLAGTCRVYPPFAGLRMDLSVRF